MNAKKIIISAIVIWIVTAIFGWLTCGWLFNGVYQIPPNIWQSIDFMMSPANMIISAVIGFFVALIFVSVFAYLYKGIPGEGVKKGLHYGFIVWLVGALSGLASLPIYMTISITVVVYWIVQALVLGLINGAIAGALYKESTETE